jgi:hypothetical protein
LLNILVRNALGEWKTIIDPDNNIITWKHIVNLYEYQKKHGFTLANKLTKQHIMFDKNKMKVKLAVQVLSKSVANSLLTMSELKIDNFDNVNPTVHYLQVFDSLYDVMNSRTLAESFGKAPMQARNEKNWRSVFEKAVSYITNLKTEAGKPVLQSNRYAAFLGWLVNMLKGTVSQDLMKFEMYGMVNYLRLFLLYCISHVRDLFILTGFS